MHIRPYTPADAAMVAQLHPHHLDAAVESGGTAWLCLERERLLGYVAAAPVPGLPGVVELEGYVRPAVRRHGVGSTLLHHLLSELAQSDVRQISHEVPSLRSPSALFLLHHGFYLEHEEWQMVLDDVAALPPLQLPSGCDVRAFERQQALSLFRRLYDEAFAGTPWYQPYTSNAEVAAELDRAGNLRFLTCAGQPVGVAWARPGGAGDAEIEPIGVAKEVQGQGFGRALLLAALHYLVDRGARRVRLGVWRDNTAAIRLYQSVGFHRHGRRFYLAYDLGRL